MATFTAKIQLNDATKIQLNDATKQDYENLFSKLEKQLLKSKCHIVKDRLFVDGKSDYKWRGNISIQEIASAVLRSVSGIGRKYSFTITRRKVAG